MAKVKASIYLLKPGIKHPEECIGPKKDVSRYETGDDGIVFYNNPSREPRNG